MPYSNKKPEAGPAAPQPDSIPPQPARTVLLVENDGEVRAAVGRLLRKIGLIVILARSGADALTKARRHNGPIHLLISDVDMPGISGLQLAAAFHAERPTAKIVLMSGLHGGIAAANEGWSFIPKPLILKLLKVKIDLLLNGTLPP